LLQFFSYNECGGSGVVESHSDGDLTVLAATAAAAHSQDQQTICRVAATSALHFGLCLQNVCHNTCDGSSAD
jgi:hypothetical protein